VASDPRDSSLRIQMKESEEISLESNQSLSKNDGSDDSQLNPMQYKMQKSKIHVKLPKIEEFEREESAKYTNISPLLIEKTLPHRCLRSITRYSLASHPA
jgi:hypothetical protein